jgi:SAM-dependent methyltransferase
MSKSIVNEILNNVEEKIILLTKENPRHDYALDYFYFHKARYVQILKYIEKFHFSETKKILDVGSYPYHLALALSLMGFSMGAINLAKGVYEETVEKRFGIKILPVDLADEKLPYEKGNFDLLLFSETIEHLNFNQKNLFKEFERIIKPGGKIILTTPNLARLNNRIKLLIGKSINNEVDKAFYPYIHCREYTDAELIHIFKKAGFNNIKIIFTNFYYPDMNFFIKIINKIVGFILPSTRSNIIIIAEKNL